MKTILLTASLLVATVSVLSAASSGDDFNDNHIDLRRWGPDERFGHGRLTERNGRLEYTCAGGTSEDDLIRRWRAGNGPYNSDWEIQIDLFNSTSFTPNSIDQNNSFGLKLRGPSNDTRSKQLKAFPMRIPSVMSARARRWKVEKIPIQTARLLTRAAARRPVRVHSVILS